MGMITFFPWLRQRRPLRVDQFFLFPFSLRDARLPRGIKTSTKRTDIASIISPYRQLPAHPLESACLLQYGDLPIDAYLDEGQRQDVFRFSRYLAVAGLSTRRLVGDISQYSARGHYQAIVQEFPQPYRGSFSVGHRRKDGITRAIVAPEAQVFLLPEHLVQQASPLIDTQLLRALYEPRISAELRARINASTMQFLMANTDSPDVPVDAEIVSTYAAIERSVDAEQNDKSIRKKVAHALAVADSLRVAKPIKAELGLGEGDA